MTGIGGYENFQGQMSRSNCDHDGTRDTVSSLYNHIPNIINLSKKTKLLPRHKNTLKISII